MSERVIEFDQLILERIIDIGSGMLKAGGEIKRVEETITRLCLAYGAEYTDVMAITSDIIVTVRFKDDAAITQSRRMENQQVDMMELEFYNQLSREICAYPLTYSEISEKLKQKSKRKIAPALSALVWAIVSASFTLFFGGKIVDAFLSFAIGVALFLFYNTVSTRINNYYCVMVLCSVFGGLIPFLLRIINPQINSFYINIGNIMLLIPGVALTTSIRDMFSGDTISGLLEFFEAMLVGFVIAFGFAMMNSSYTINSSEHSKLLEIGTAIIGSFGFAMIFNCRYKIGIIGALIGGMGWIIVILVTKYEITEYIAFFFAAMFITIFSRIMARLLKCPSTLFLRAGVIPLVPGKDLYLTMIYALREEWQLLFKQSISTLLYAICISAGILLVSIIFDIRENG